MKRCFSIVMLQLAAALMLLHALVPHVHHEEAQSFHVHPSLDEVSLPEAIGLVFHLTDPGQGHLEHALFQTAVQHQDEVVALATAANGEALRLGLAPLLSRSSIRALARDWLAPLPPLIAGWVMRGPPRAC